MEKGKNAPSEDKTQEAKAKAEPKVEEAKGENKDATISELMGNESEKETESRTVPEATFLKVKKELKKLKREKSEKETVKSSDLRELADKHDLDADFLEDLSKSIRLKTKAEMEEELSSKLQPFEEKDRQKKIDAIFEEQYQKTMEKLPQYKNIANKDVIKSLSMQPNNANKTFAQLVELSYGHLVKGKGSIDNAQTKTYNNNDTEVDIERANKDSEYFRHVMANPTLKKKYNASLVDNIAQYM